MVVFVTDLVFFLLQIFVGVLAGLRICGVFIRCESTNLASMQTGKVSSKNRVFRSWPTCTILVISNQKGS